MKLVSRITQKLLEQRQSFTQENNHSKHTGDTRTCLRDSVNPTSLRVESRRLHPYEKFLFFFFLIRVTKDRQYIFIPQLHAWFRLIVMSYTQQKHYSCGHFTSQLLIGFQQLGLFCTWSRYSTQENTPNVKRNDKSWSTDQHTCCEGSVDRAVKPYLGTSQSKGMN